MIEDEYTLIEDLAFLRKCHSIPEEKIITENPTPDTRCIEISSSVFANSQLKRVTIPATVEVLGYRAFFKCTGLVEVTFAERSRLLQIRKECFRECVNLVEFFCPSSVIEVGDKSFYRCHSLTRFDLKEDSKLQRLGFHAFKWCKIRNFRITKGLPIKDSIFVGIHHVGSAECFTHEFDNGLLLSNDRNNLWNMFSDDEKISVPAGVVHLENECFDTCPNAKVMQLCNPCWLTWINTRTMRVIDRIEHDAYFIKESDHGYIDQNHRLMRSYSTQEEIVIPDDITKIGHCCFYRSKTLKKLTLNEASALDLLSERACAHSSIEEVYFNNTVTRFSIELKAFFGCKSLKKVVFAENCPLRAIHHKVFMHSGLVSITIPKEVVRIGDRCFYDCKNLEKVEFAPGCNIDFLGSEAFALTAITDICLPKVVKVFGNRALLGIPSVSVEAGDGILEVINDSYLVSKTANRLVYYFGNDEDLVIPKGIAVIGSWAFCGKKNFASINFEEGSILKKIESGAFNGCTVESIELPDGASDIIGLGMTIKNISGTFSADLQIDGEFINSSDNVTMLKYTGGENSCEICSFIGELGTGCFAQDKKIQTVTFEEGTELVSMKNNAFCGSGLISIEIPNTVEELHSGCFSNTDALYYVKFQEASNMKRILPSCWQSSSIRSIVLPPGIEEVPVKCFFMCTCLSSVTFEDGGAKLKKICDSAFSQCPALLNFEIPNAVESIGVCAFHASGIRKVRIPSSVTTLSVMAFDHCLLLESVEFDDTKITELEQSLFAVTALEEIVIPKSVQVIKQQCFVNCKLLKRVTFVPDNDLEEIEHEAFMFTGLEKIVIPKKCTTIGRDCFKFCKDLTVFEFEKDSAITEIRGDNILTGTSVSDLRIPDGVVYIDPSFIAGVKNLAMNEDKFTVISNLVFTKNNDLIGSYGGHESSNLVISKNVNHITTKCFYLNKFIDYVSFESGVNLSKFESLLFSKSTLEKIIVPQCIEVIESNCFTQCKALRSVEFEPESRLVHIKHSAFTDTSLESIIIPKHVKAISRYCFSECRVLKSVIFEDGCEIEKIGKHAFEETDIKEITIPKGIQMLKEWCFARCDISYCVFEEGGSEKILRNKVFSNLDKLVLSSNITEVSGGFLSGIRNVVVGDGHQYLVKEGNLLLNRDKTLLIRAFGNMESITIPRSVKVIGSEAFDNMISLVSVEFEDGSLLEKLDKRSLARTSIERIVLPKHFMTLGHHCFYQCSKLREIEIHEDAPIDVLPNNIFDGCRINVLKLPGYLKSIHTKALRNVGQVELSKRNEFLTSMGDFIGTIDKKCLVALIGNPTNVTIPKEIEQIPENFFESSEVTAVAFDNDSQLTVLCKWAFSKAPIREITIPKSVITIEEECFSHCSNLKTVRFDADSHLKSIKRGAFSGCNIREIVIPKSVEFIGGGAVGKIKEVRVEEGSVNFRTENGYIYNATGDQLRGWYQEGNNKFIIPAEVKAICRECFHTCDWLYRFGYDDLCALETIQEYAFYDSNIVYVNIPPSVKKIEPFAFCKSDINELTFAEGCSFTELPASMASMSRLLKVVIPSSVERLGPKCFAKCALLSEVIFQDGSNLKSIGRKCFTGAKIQSITFPECLRSIEEKAFRKCRSLSSVTFGDNSLLTYIGASCFEENRSLNEISLPSTVRYMPKNVFDAECNVTFWLNNEQKTDIGSAVPAFDLQLDIIDKVFMEDLEDLGVIGSGSFGTVHLVQNKYVKQQYAQKQIVLRPSNRVEVSREIAALKMFDHPCLIKLGGCLDATDSQTSVSIFMEYVPNGTLADAIRDKPSWYTPTVRAKIAVGIAAAMEVAHSMNLLHRDLKPSNILIDADYNAKVADWGCARQDSSEMTHQVGTKCYMAPEMYTTNANYTNKIDVYSYGLILYEIVEGRSVFGKMRDLDIMRIIRNDVNRVIEFSETIMEETEELIRKCLSMDVENRPSFSEVLDFLSDMSYEIVEGVDHNEVVQYQIYLASKRTTT